MITLQNRPFQISTLSQLRPTCSRATVRCFLAGGAAEGGSVISSSSAGGDGTAGWSQSLDTEEKVAAALSAALASRATAEADAVEVTAKQ